MTIIRMPFALQTMGCAISTLLIFAPFVQAAEPAFSVAIEAIDAQTKMPIKSFRVVPTPFRERARTVTWQSQYLKSYTSQPAVFQMKRGWDLSKLRIEADGYLPYVTKPLKRDAKLKLSIALQPDEGLKGRILTPAGAPAKNAEVAVCTWTNEVTVRDGKLRYGHHAERLRGMLKTAEDGSFHAPSEVDEWVLVVAHESGYVEATSSEFAKQSTLKLKPWGRLEGDFIVRGKPMKQQAINIGAGRGDVNVVLHYSVGQVQTNDEGRFLAEHLPPVKLYVSPMHKFGESSFNLFWFGGLVEVQTGQTTRISIPRPGKTVTGKFKLPAGSDLKVEELDFVTSLYLRPPRISRIINRGNGNGGPHAAYSAFMQSEPGEAFRKDGVPADRNGSFKIEGMPETNYVLSASAFLASERTQPKRRPVATFVTRVSLKARTEEEPTLDLGDLTMRLDPSVVKPDRR